MSSQLPLIPVSDLEMRESAYRIAVLLTQRDEAVETFAEVRKQHKEHIGGIDREIRECRQTIRRAQWEAEEGLMQQQVDALMNSEEERRPSGPSEAEPRAK